MFRAETNWIGTAIPPNDWAILSDRRDDLASSDFATDNGSASG
jgi:hypothetical protein